jgi:methyl-accepting chemotaxis protein
MIQDLLVLLRLYRPKLLLILLILAMPWAWAAFWVPWWVNLVCFLMVPVAAGILMFRVLPAPEEPRRESDEPNISDAQIRKMRKMSSGVHNLLSRWTNVSDRSRTHIEEVSHHVDEVMAYSETAVVEIGKRFVAVTRKTRKQVEFALGILEHTRPGGSKHESRPLPELVSAYEELAAKIAASLAKVADSVEHLEKRHDAVRKDFAHVDTLLDQLSTHDSQIGVLALNTSVKGGTSAQDFVSVSDQIRTLSLESKALTRDIRRTLEQVRGQATTTHAAVRNAVAQAREASQFASVESNKLTREMLFNSQEVAETLSQIGAIGNEIQKDINEIIVALQFQDITHQKLQRLKDPMLSDLMVSLRAIFDETRSLSSKLEGSGMVEQGGAPRLQPEGVEVPAPHMPQAPRNRRKGDEAVEIF